jgi:hypothetical protein
MTYSVTTNEIRVGGIDVACLHATKRIRTRVKGKRFKNDSRNHVGNKLHCRTHGRLEEVDNNRVESLLL